MAYSPSGVYVKSVAIPRYTTDSPRRGNPPIQVQVKPPALGNGARSPLPKTGHATSLTSSASVRSGPNGTQSNASQTSVNGANSGEEAAMQPRTVESPFDYQLILLSMAEEYFSAAHASASSREMEINTYHKLIATGLGCLETLLKNWKLQPQREVLVRLKYATVLYEETENTAEAEEALNKGIIICDRHRLFDMKYNMQHLLARVLFRVNPRASLKFLDGVIQDVGAYQHIAWVYAFRFLRVSLSFELPTHQDTMSALAHLRSISTLSNRFGDKHILAVAMTIETMTHLRQPISAETVEQSQRSLAVARSCQADPSVFSHPQLAAFMQFVDLCSILQRFDPSQATSKMQAMQGLLENIPENNSWTKDGSFAVPIGHSDNLLSSLNDGVIRRLQDGRPALVFKWLPKEDIYTLGFLLGGLTMSHRNSNDGQKAEQLFREGLRSQRRNLEKPNKICESVGQAASRYSWRQMLRSRIQLHLTFTLCLRTAWVDAQDHLRQLKETVSSLPLPSNEELKVQIHYLEGVIQQGTGALTDALQTFQSPSLALPAPSHPAPSPLHHDLFILSALNTLLIIRNSTHPSHHILPSLITSIESLCLSPPTPNKSLLAAAHLLLATSSPSSTIVRTKQHLQSALQITKQVANNQIMCMTLNFMSWKFFRGVVGDQAEKSARASQVIARKGMDRLWSSVAAGVLSDTLEVMGRSPEAEQVRKEGREIAKGLPRRIWRDREVQQGCGATEEA